MKNDGKWRILKKIAGDSFELQYVIAIAFTVITVIAIIFVGGALYIPFYNSMLRTVENDHRQIIEQVNLSLDGYLRSMMKISDSVYYRIIKNTDFSEDTISDELSLLYDANGDMLVSIAVFTDEGSVVAAVPLSNVKNTIDVTSQQWFIQAKRKIENLHFGAPHVQNVFEDADFSYRWVVSLSRSVSLTYGGEINYGVLTVDMNFSTIEQICRRVNLGDMGYAYIMDQNGEIIYHPDQQLIYSDLKNENIERAVYYEDGGHIEKFEGRKRFVTIKTVGYTGWKIVGVSYIDEVTPYREVAFFTVLVIMLVICFMILLNQYVSSRIANPIKLLEQSVREIDSGRLDVPVSVSGSVEVRHLGAAINGLLNQIKMLMDEIVQEQEQKLKSEFDALQSQINPHFLYNALDSVIWMIERGNNKQAVVMVSAISRLFRIGISRGDNIISIGSELEHVKNYLTIQNIRFKNKFKYEIRSDDSVKNMSTIKLIIQPIVENAIHHGMEFMDGDGMIIIDASVKDMDVYITVSDNGYGIPENDRKELLKAPAESKESSGIGLYNVQKRIQLYFGEDYGLTIESEPDEGTTVTIRLPAVSFNKDRQKQ